MKSRASVQSLDQAYDAFEDDLRGNGLCRSIAQAIDAALSKLDESERELLRFEVAAEFLRLQIGWAYRFDQDPKITELKQQFPEHGAIIDSAVANSRPKQTVNGEGPVTTLLVSPELGLKAGRRVCFYELIEHLGSGGMGTVWKARQLEPVQREVALKFMRQYTASRELFSRFRNEQQALAVLDHSNIAKIFDSGKTPDDHFFFVMEMVSGGSVTRFADREGLSPRQRVELMLPVCHAIQHAHQKGIIHRDLKPSNVLVHREDEELIPKVIDFGLAKATGPPLTNESLHSVQGQLLGTPEYMSPEQTRLGQIDIDTRADIYALGAILFELLTGRPPFETARLRSMPMEDALNTIREEEVPLPSTLAREPKSVRGELDWIVGKCLEKDRSRRYDSAAALAADLKRYLEGAPVEAVPPTAVYRAQKFVRKNRTFVVAASIIVVALVFGILGTSWGMFRALIAEQTTEARRKEAEKNLAYAQRTVAALQTVLKQATPWTHGNTAQQAEEISLQLEILLTELPGESDVDQRELAKIRKMFGEIMMDLGHPKKSVSILQAGVAECQRLYGRDHQETIDSMTFLARAFLLSNRVAEAVQTCEQVFELQSQKHGPYAIETFKARNQRDNYYMYVDPFYSAQRADETLQLSKTHYGPEELVTLRSLQVLQSACRESFQYEKAIELGCQLVELTKKRNFPDWLLHLASGPRNGLAAAYTDSGLFEKGQTLFRECYDFRVEYYGRDHPYTLHTMGWLGRSYLFDGNLELALPILEERYEHSLTQLGPHDPSTLEGKSNLGAAYRESGRLELSRRLLEETLTSRQIQFGFDHRDTLWTSLELAKTYAATKYYEESLELFETTTFLMELSLGCNDPDLLAALAGMAEVQLELGNFEAAENLIDLSVQGIERLNFFHRVACPIVKAAVQVYEAVNRVEASVQLVDRWQVARLEHLIIAESCEKKAFNNSSR
jgi:serine/threonine protein kinase/tetratricopeptide (TPR) repeat protein